MDIQITEKDFIEKYYSYLESLLQDKISSIRVLLPEENKTLKVKAK